MLPTPFMCTKRAAFNVGSVPLHRCIVTAFFFLSSGTNLVAQGRVIYSERMDAERVTVYPGGATATGGRCLDRLRNKERDLLWSSVACGAVQPRPYLIMAHHRMRVQ